MVFVNKSKGYLLGPYYIILWEGYPEKEYNLKTSLEVLHFYKFISIYYHNYLEKLSTTSPLINSTLIIAKLTIKPIIRSEALTT